jgi:predicted kinase
MAPMLIAIAGLPGAGKSTLAKGLQRECHAEIVSRDTLRLSEFPDWDDHAAKRAAFEVLRLDVSVLLRAGATVIVDGATLSTRAERSALRTLANAEARPFALLWVDTPAELAAERIAADTVEAPRDRQPGLAHAVARRFEPPEAAEAPIVLDGRLTPAQVLEAALAALRTRT